MRPDFILCGTRKRGAETGVSCRPNSNRCNPKNEVMYLNDRF